MKEITVKEFFEMYPFKIKGVAEKCGKSREWLSKFVTGEKKPRPEDLLLINNAIKQVASDLACVNLT